MQRLTPALAARKLVDFAGPHGWEHSATNLGRTTPLDRAPARECRACSGGCCRWSSCGPTSSSRRAELRDADRGADDTDLGPLDKAAHQIAVAENIAVFHGWRRRDRRHRRGLAPRPGARSATPPTATRGRSPAPSSACSAAGSAGPTALALGREQYRRVVETAEHGGYPLLEHLRKILDGPIVWAPGVKGAVVLSLRGGDFLFESGQDLSIGYESHDAEAVRLYLEESFSFHVATPEAAVALKP